MDKPAVNTSDLPRVTPNDIEAAIKEVHYLNDGVLTICILTMQNDFKVTGESACAHPSLYNKELGESIALGKAKEKLWPLLGYALRDKLFHELHGNFRTRLEAETQQLHERVGKLRRFLASDGLQHLKVNDVDLLKQQLPQMEAYLETLHARMKRLGA
jgi:hypothetical protein